MKKAFFTFLLLVSGLILMAQTTINGVVQIAGTNDPAANVHVLLAGMNESVMTNNDGEFSLTNTKVGNDWLVISQEG